MKDGTLHIAFGIDLNFLHPMCVTAISILENNPDMVIEFHVFTFFISEWGRQKLAVLENQYRTSFHIHVIDEDMFCAQYPGKANVLLLRLLMADILRNWTDRFLYLDADMICIGPLQELAHINLDGRVAAVVSDIPRTVMRQSASLNLATKHYFNSGFMLINVREWVSRDICNVCMYQIITNSDQFDFLDQDALNVAIGDQVKFINGKFNYICDLSRVPEHLTPEKAAIIHYAGPLKPWHALKWASNADIWEHYSQMSPWKEEPPVPFKVARHMRIYARLLYRLGRKQEAAMAYFSYLRMKLRQSF